MEQYRYVLITKDKVGEVKNRSIYKYLEIIADQVGLVLKERGVYKWQHPKSCVSPIQPEPLKET